MSHGVTTRRTLLAGSLSASTLAAVAGGAAAKSLGPEVPASPSVSFFLKLDGIPGDSERDGHEDEIEVLDLSFGVRSSISPDSSTGGASKSKANDFLFVARSGRQTPKLFLSCAAGKRIATGLVTARHTIDGQTTDYLTIKLKDVLVTSYSTAPAPVGATPLDVFALEFAAMTVTYRPQNPDGSLGTAISAGFDFLLNKVL